MPKNGIMDSDIYFSSACCDRPYNCHLSFVLGGSLGLLNCFIPCFVHYGMSIWPFRLLIIANSLPQSRRRIELLRKSSSQARGLSGVHSLRHTSKPLHLRSMPRRRARATSPVPTRTPPVAWLSMKHAGFSTLRLHRAARPTWRQ